MSIIPTADDVRAKVAELHALGLRFDATLNKLLSLENVAKLNETAWQRWNDLRSRGISGKSTIAKGIEAIQSAQEWLRQSVGLSDIGFAPLLIGVALAAIIAAISFASGWLAQADPEIRRLEILQASIANLPETDRARILAEAAKRTTPSITGNLAQMAMFLALGLAFVFVIPKLLDKKG